MATIAPRMLRSERRAAGTYRAVAIECEVASVARLSAQGMNHCSAAISNWWYTVYITSHSIPGPDDTISSSSSLQ
jgi:hypothetical protein